MIRFRKISFFLPLFFILFYAAGWGYAGSKTLMINPIRAVFEGRTRSVNVHVSNTNPEPIKYRISLVTMRKGKDGKLVFAENETEKEKFVKSMIRFSPRQATIAPGTRQVVKLMVRKPADLPKGEYQTRIRFMPLAGPAAALGNPDGGSGKPRLNVDLLVGVTIPVVIQHGKVDSAVKPVNLSLQKLPQVPSGLAAVITLLRSGGYSAFGDVFVSYFGESEKKKIIIGSGESVGIYIPDTSRTFAVPLHSLEQVDLTGGTLRVGFVQQTRSSRTPVVTYKDFKLSSK